MADRYQQFVDSPPGRFMVRRLGLPQPAPLQRGAALLDGPILLGGALDTRDLLTRIGFEVRADAERYAALIFDASGISRTSELRELYDFVHPAIRQLGPSGRLIVIGSGEGIAQRALEGFVRSAGKEVRHGATANLLVRGAWRRPRVDAALPALRPLGLRLRPGDPGGSGGARPAGQLDGRRHRRLARHRRGHRRRARPRRAHVICADVPAQGEDLAAVANAIGGTALQVDVTSDRAPAIIAERRPDIVVHNAGITRDRTLARMSEDEWDSVLAVNLESIERINEALTDVRRIVCVSSVSGIAGNRGQANYATSKAGVIGVVQELAPKLTGGTINAVAPGFIETRMTAAMPLATREAGRRMNSLAQGGLPVDVAETVAWLAAPGSAGVNGNVVRVCGQSLIGA